MLTMHYLNRTFLRARTGLIRFPSRRFSAFASFTSTPVGAVTAGEATSRRWLTLLPPRLTTNITSFSLAVRCPSQQPTVFGFDLLDLSLRATKEPLWNLL